MKALKPPSKTFLFNEMKMCENLVGKLNPIYDTLRDLVWEIESASVNENYLKDYFIDKDQFETISKAFEILESMQESAYNYGRRKGIELLKAS